jgi:hypothetical protein
MKVITVTYLMKVITVTYLMKVITVTYLMKVITVTYYIRYLRFYYYHWIDTSAGGPLVLDGIILPVFSPSKLTWFIENM